MRKELSNRRQATPGWAYDLLGREESERLIAETWAIIERTATPAQRRARWMAHKAEERTHAQRTVQTWLDHKEAALRAKWKEAKET